MNLSMNDEHVERVPRSALDHESEARGVSREIKNSEKLIHSSKFMK